MTTIDRIKAALAAARHQLQMNEDIAKRDHPEGPIVDGKRLAGVVHSQEILTQHVFGHLDVIEMEVASLHPHTQEEGERWEGPAPEQHLRVFETVSDNVNDPYPGFVVSGYDEEGREIIAPSGNNPTREQQIVAMAEVLRGCRWFRNPTGTMEDKPLVWATNLWEAAHPAPQTNVAPVESRLSDMIQELIGELDSLPWLPEEICDQMSAVDQAIEKAKAAPPYNITNDQKEITLLRIIDGMGGKTDSGDYSWSWLNWFCNDGVHLEYEDTFNRCNEKGWLSTTHDSDTDHSITTITEKGRDALSFAADQPAPVSTALVSPPVDNYGDSGD